jgi:hypothetical protein
MADTPADEHVLRAPAFVGAAGDLTGTLAVLQKTASAWELAIGDATISVDTPTGADLSLLAGVTGTAHLGDGDLWIEDADGAVVYLLTQGAGDLGAEAFGRAIAARGEAWGTFYDAGWQVDYGGVDFAADGGTTSVGPGESGGVVLDGASWRATVIAALAVSRESDAASRCGPADTLSYELLRVTEAPTDEARTRASDEEYGPPGGDCQKPRQRQHDTDRTRRGLPPPAGGAGGARTGGRRRLAAGAGGRGGGGCLSAAPRP